MMSRYRDVLFIICPLWWETTYHQWIPLTKGQLCETLMFSFYCYPEQAVEQPVMPLHSCDITLNDGQMISYDEPFCFQMLKF